MSAAAGLMWWLLASIVIGVALGSAIREMGSDSAEPADDDAEDIAMPWWFWEAAALVFVAVLALSSIFPWGFAS